MLLLAGAAWAGKTQVEPTDRSGGGREKALESLLEARRRPLEGNSLGAMRAHLLALESRLASLVGTGPADAISVAAAGNLARSLSARGELEAAVSVVERMRGTLSAPPDRFDATRLLAEIYAASGKPGEAVALLKNYLREKPPEQLRDRAEAGLIHFEAEAGLFDEAGDLTMLQLLPGAPVAHALELRIAAAGYWARGKNPAQGLAAGEELLAEALRLGWAGEVQRVLGTACASLGRLDDASGHFRRAIAGSGGEARTSAAVEESDMWQRAGRIERAIAALDAGLSVAAGSARDIGLATRRASLARLHQPAPENMSTTTEGETVRLSSSRGKVLLLFFSATYSSDAVATFGELRELRRELAPRGFEIVGVSLDSPGDRQLLRSQLVRRGVTWKTLVSDSGEWHPIALAFGVKSVPQTILVDREFRVAATGLLGKELADAAREAVARRQGPGSPLPARSP